MKKLGLILGLLWSASVTLVSAQTVLSADELKARAAHKPIEAIKIIIVGDSTQQAHTGFGGEFCAHHVTSQVVCVNLARGGRSTFSYRAEGSWAIALDEMKSAGYQKVYVIIQFGHNDQPGKPGRSTDLATEFPANLRAYVLEARATGAIPILVTPLTRRSFKDFRLEPDLEDWAKATRKVAQDENVALFDFYKLSYEYVQGLGPVASLDLAQIAPPQDVIDAAKGGSTTVKPPKPEDPAPPAGAAKGQIKPYYDYTHVGGRGAELFASLFAEGLAQSVPELATYLIK